MRVGLVCPYDLTVPGGVQAHVTSLARELRRAGDDVAVVAPSRGEAAEGVVSAGASLGVPFNGSVAPLARSPAGVRRALGELAAFAPDVVHVHEPAAPLLSLAATLSAAVPLVGTFHAWSERDLLYRAARPVGRWAAGRLAVRLAVSPPARDYHARALGLVPDSFDVVPNGVDVARFAAAEPLDDLAGDDAPTVLFVGRLERRKGVVEAVRAFIAARARRSSARLLVVGEGPERDRAAALVPDAVRGDVRFLGRVDPPDLPRVYASADVFLAPALGGESFGIVLLEAMAAGLPLVASAIPGYRAVVRDGMEGRLVPPGDWRALAEALHAVLSDPTMREAFAARSRETVAGYDWPVVAGRVRDRYAEAVAAGPGR